MLCHILLYPSVLISRRLRPIFLPSWLGFKSRSDAAGPFLQATC